MDLADKVCIVTGAAGGIGKSIARELASRGGDVIIADINDQEAESTFQQIKAEYKDNRPQLPRWFAATANIRQVSQEFLSGSAIYLQSVSLEPS